MRHKVHTNLVSLLALSPEAMLLQKNGMKFHGIELTFLFYDAKRRILGRVAANCIPAFYSGDQKLYVNVEGPRSSSLT